MIIFKNILSLILAIAFSSFTQTSFIFDEGLKLVISSERTIYRIGDSILIEVKIVNLSEGKIAFVWPPFEKTIDYNYKTFQGEEKSGGILYGCSDRSFDEKLIMLGKNEFFGEIVNISKEFSIKETGIYNIKINYKIGDSIRPIEPAWVDTSILVYTRHLSSNIEIKITN
jgi:hypothetical protein